MRTLSLAAGVLPEFAPDVIARSAALAGYRATGIWCDTKTWTDATTRMVAGVLDEHQLVALDIEVIWMGPGAAASDAARRLLDIGAALGARNALIVSANPDLEQTKHQFAALCELAARANMRAALEFLMITPLRTLAQALEVVRDVGHPAGGVLIDALHLQRCGAGIDDIRAIEPDLLPYAQLCDAPAHPAGTGHADYLRDALDARTVPGDGGLPLDEFVRSLPDRLPLSLEVRSKALRERHPDPIERARAVRDATVQFLAGID
jgi:sugar phosphate isomerase/epimerase